jgi:hypothetical protein
MDYLNLSGEHHCEYCHCPKEIWKPTIKNYQGDECQLIDTFFSLVEDWMTPEELTEVTMTELPKEYLDIENIEALAKELVEIAIECGLIRDKNTAN